MYLSIYSDRETAQRYFPRRTKGPEMWADSDSWSLLPFREKSHVRLFPTTDFNPQVILCSSEQCLEEGREWLLPSLLSHLPGKGGEQLSPLLCKQPLTSYLPTAAQRSEPSGPLCRAEMPTEPLCVWYLRCVASHHLVRRAGSTTLPSCVCLPTHFLHGNLCSPAGKQRDAHETFSSSDMSLSTLTYRAQQTSSEQRGLHSDPVAALLQPSHAHWQSWKKEKYLKLTFIATIKHS